MRRSGNRFIGRREFVKGAGVLAAAGALGAPRALRAEGAILGANERVRIGFIGVGNRGEQLLDAFLRQKDIQVTALCDVYDPYIDHAAGKIGGTVARFRDYRRLLEMEEIDAVVIATPDHWHARQFIDACRAGKDIYVEKPLSLAISEGRKMVEAARRGGRVTQVGIQRRSTPYCQRAAELVRSGAIGKVTVARSYHVLNELPAGIGNPPDGPPPDGLDWDMWLGPAPKVPYNPNRCHYKFRWFWDYSGGQLTNFGTHYLDFIQWALGKRAPLAVTAMGGKFALEDNREVPDTLEVLWLYDGGTMATFTQINANAAPPNVKNAHLEFRGTLGTLYIGYGGFDVVPEQLRTHPVPARNPLDRKEPRTTVERIEPLEGKGGIDDADHVRDFLDCVKSRRQACCDIETGHRSTSATLLGNIALKTKKYLEWDAEEERITNVPEANRYLSCTHREPWGL